MVIRRVSTADLNYSTGLLRFYYICVLAIFYISGMKTSSRNRTYIRPFQFPLLHLRYLYRFNSRCPGIGFRQGGRTRRQRRQKALSPLEGVDRRGQLAEHGVQAGPPLAPPPDGLQ